MPSPDRIRPMLGDLFKPKKQNVGKMGEQLPEENRGLPDSDRPHGLCPRCEKQSSFEVKGNAPVTVDARHYVVGRTGDEALIPLDQVSILYCRNCQQGIVVIEEQCTAGHSWREPGGPRSGTISWRGIHWWPAADEHVSQDVPPKIAEAYSEAVRAAHANCFRASAAMARRTLEAIAADKGEVKGVLAERLKNLAVSGMLVPTLADWAREVRLVGNAGVHFDPMDAVSRVDAEQLIAFLRELLRYLYELPAELARRRGNP